MTERKLSPRPRIAAVGSAFPPHYYDQDALLAEFKQHWAAKHFNLGRLERIHRNVLVGGRHLALPIERYAQLNGFGEANDAWIRVAQDVGEEAVRRALTQAGLDAKDVDAFLFVTVTGVATPSIDALLVNRLGMDARVKRMPFFGLGCVAGTAGVARAADYLRAFPDQVAVLLSVELCSLTLQRRDLSIPNVIASGLFGDGAAAAVLVGGEHPLAQRQGQQGGPRVLASRSVFYPGTEDVMGWKVSEEGFQVVLSSVIPNLVREHLPGNVDAFLAEHGLERGDVKTWISHPGGPKILDAMAEALELPEDALALTWRTLRERGNLSSTSVLLVLEETLTQRSAAPLPSDGYGMMLAMGPGFCSELVLVEWP